MTEHGLHVLTSCPTYTLHHVDMVWNTLNTNTLKSRAVEEEAKHTVCFFVLL